MDPRDRFAATVDDYRRHRPDYPPALVEWIIEDAELHPGRRVIDVGCGTGISSRQLAARGLEVVGVDPNEAMLAEARRAGGAVRYLRADAESFTLDETADAITGGQCFHWFDLDRALLRFRAHLRRGGRVIAFWNLRDADDAFMAAYEALLVSRCPDYASVAAEPRAREVLQHPRLRERREATFEHRQRLDRASFHGRVWSSSYVRHGVVDRESFDRALDALFDSHAEEGAVWFRYRSLAVSFVP